MRKDLKLISGKSSKFNQFSEVIKLENTFQCWEANKLVALNISLMRSLGKQWLSVYITLTSKESKDQLTNLKQELSTKDSGKVGSEMALENRLGQMVQNILVSGEKTELMEKEDSYMLMEIFMMVFGQTIKLMVSEFISMWMVPSMKENGRMTCSMVKE